MVVAATCPTDDTLSRAIGQRLRVLREARGIRRELVALALDMGSENLRHYEAGRSRLALEHLPAIADIYGMSVGELATLLLAAPEREKTERSA